MSAAPPIGCFRFVILVEKTGRAVRRTWEGIALEGHEPPSWTEGRERASGAEPPPLSEFPAPVMSLAKDADVREGELSFSVTPRNLPGRNGPFPHPFGRYRLLEWLGGGGMGSVFLAWDLKLEIKVALKVPKPGIAADVRGRERFYREARHAARLVHPGLAWVLDVAQADGMDYLVMRYVAGTPLSRYPASTPREAAALIREVAIAMAAAHREGVIHRDLKPSNIVVTAEGIPVVIDFGLAVLMDDPGRDRPIPACSLEHRALRRPSNSAAMPTRSVPTATSSRLGCVLYERLARRLPFPNPRRR